MLIPQRCVRILVRLAIGLVFSPPPMMLAHPTPLLPVHVTLAVGGASSSAPINIAVSGRP